MTQRQIEYAIAELQRRLASDFAVVESQELRIVILENLLLNIPANRLLGRYAATAGASQYIQIGLGLDLQGDTLVNTGGGGGDPVVISSFTLICVDDTTEHEITCVLTESGHYVLRPNQAPGGSGAVASKTLTCEPPDSTDHELELRLVDGYYNVEVVQPPGGTGAVDSITMTASDLTTQILRLVLQDGYYTWTFS